MFSPPGPPVKGWNAGGNTAGGEFAAALAAPTAGTGGNAGGGMPSAGSADFNCGLTGSRLTGGTIASGSCCVSAIGKSGSSAWSTLGGKGVVEVGPPGKAIGSGNFGPAGEALGGDAAGGTGTATGTPAAGVGVGGELGSCAIARANKPAM